jgi:hypothetical protein
MQEVMLLNKFKDINNYNNPHNVIAKSIVHFDVNTTSIIKELFEMLQDNFAATKSILGEELTNIVLMQKMLSY